MLSPYHTAYIYGSILEKIIEKTCDGAINDFKMVLKNF
jgi:hypothetical protein